MRLQGLQSDVITYTAVISAGARCGAWVPLTSYILTASRVAREELILWQHARAAGTVRGTDYAPPGDMRIRSVARSARPSH